MPKIHVERSVVINENIDKIFGVVSDFHTWTVWSPWLITEKEAKVDVREDGKYYEWSGKVVGSGNMSVLNEEQNKTIDYSLTFLTPYKSKAEVSFILSSVDHSSTRLIWTMDSSLPFFMFFFKKRMESMIGMDYERGLKMLKEYIETGKVQSEVNVKGNTEMPKYQYIGVRSMTSISKMGEQHKQDFERLMGYARECDVAAAGVPHTIYHKWDPMKDSVEYTAVYPVENIPEGLPVDFITGESEGFKGYSVEHIGAYHHLGNAWSAIYSRQYGKVFKADTRKFPVELYHNSPVDTPQDQLRTEIIMPVK